MIYLSEFASGSLKASFILVHVISRYLVVCSIHVSGNKNCAGYFMILQFPVQFCTFSMGRTK